MPTEEKKGITVKIDAELHAQVKAFIESSGLTMAEFVSQALDHELHPIQQIGGTTMENMRTLAFQVPESLFQQIKEYLQRNHMTQKQFVIGLIQSEINRDLEQRQMAETAQNQSGDADDPAESEELSSENDESEDESEESDESEDETENEGELEDDETEDESETEDEYEDSNESEDESETEDEFEDSDETEEESDTEDETEYESVAEDESMDIWM